MRSSSSAALPLARLPVTLGVVEHAEPERRGNMGGRQRLVAEMSERSIHPSHGSELHVARPATCSRSRSRLPFPVAFLLAASVPRWQVYKPTDLLKEKIDHSDRRAESQPISRCSRERLVLAVMPDMTCITLQRYRRTKWLCRRVKHSDLELLKDMPFQEYLSIIGR